MSPTVFKWKSYRFFFFSREERRPHVHIYCPDGEAKFWIEPVIELAKNYELSSEQLTELKQIVEEKRSDIINAWRRHFAS